MNLFVRNWHLWLRSCILLCKSLYTHSDQQNIVSGTRS